MVTNNEFTWYKPSDESEMSYYGRWSVFTATGKEHIEIDISDGDEWCFFVIVGTYTDGHFVCFPYMDTGCALGQLDDLFWNVDHVARALPERMQWAVGLICYGLRDCKCQAEFSP